ncbi:MAG: YfhO family protein [Clostridia bacterium]|nr:YfhO family protein [Clostridia bacterium]
MVFSYQKLTTLKPQKEKRLATFLVAMAVAACFFVPYMILSEGYFTFFGDFNVQQIPFYQMCHEAIREGNISWNWNTDLGANFVGSYAFYLLGSPFFWITLLFPNRFVPYLMGPLLILKFGFAALTAYLYIRRFTKTSNAAMLGGILYAFSGFSVYNVFFNHFHEAIIAFPLLLLSLELLITENRRGVFALAVAFCAVTNYFFFFGMVVFAVIYFFVRLFSGAIKVRLARFITLIFEAVIGLLMSAILLLPAINAILDNSRVSSTLIGWNGIMYGKEQIYLNVIQCFFFPPDLPARPVFFPGANVKWSSLGGWLPVFSMVGVFAWFTNRKGSWQKRLIAICAFMALVPILNSAFYAFNTSYYARWFYMPILIMCLVTVQLSEDMSVDWKCGWRWVMGITLGFTLTIGFFPQKDKAGKIIYGLYTQSEDYTYVARFWATSVIAIVSLVIVRALISLLRKNRTAFYRTAIACVCVVSVIYANVFIATGRAHSYEIKEVMIDSLIEGEVTLDDESNFRIDTYDCVDNTGMYLGLPTINAFHSVVPSSIMEFYKYVGVERSVGSRPETDVPALRPLLSVKYLLNRESGKDFVDEDGETLMPDYKYIKTSGDYYVYENENYVPYGFSYDYYMTQEFCDDYNEDSRSRLMLKAILLNERQIKKYGDIMQNIEDIGYEDTYETGTTLSLSDEAMSIDSKNLAETSAYSFDIDNYGFEAKVTRDKESLVFFSVPYDKGWRATVNGQAVEIEKVNVGFMAVSVPSGNSTIRFDYETPLLAEGTKLTIAAITVFLIYFIAASIFVRRRGADTKYPEGEALLSRWHKDDIAEAVRDYGMGVPQNAPRRSILDDIDGISVPSVNPKISGGFQIDPDAFKDK